MPVEEVDVGGGQSQLKPVKRKQKEKAKLEFDAAKEFSVEPAEDLDVELETESATYKARHGQGGDRRE